MAAAPEPGRIAAVTDAQPEGYGWRELGEALVRASGRTPRLVPVPAASLRVGGLAGDLAQWLGAAPMLTSGKVREILHGDWSVAAGERWEERSRPLSLQEGFTAVFDSLRAEDGAL